MKLIMSFQSNKNNKDSIKILKFRSRLQAGKLEIGQLFKFSLALMNLHQIDLFELLMINYSISQCK